jgi:RNA binding exosome subunit
MKKTPAILIFAMSNVRSAADFASVTLSFLIHATEDESRLLRQVSSSFGVPQEKIQLEVLEGYYGNYLRLAKIHVTGKEANILSDSIFVRLDRESRRALLLELEKSVDQHDSLYLRIDRQLLGERLTLGSEEPIRIKLKPKNRHGNRISVRNRYRELLED